jgi:ribosomal protein S27AE
MTSGSKHQRWTRKQFIREEDGKERKRLSCPTCGEESAFAVYLQRPLRRSDTVHKIAAYAKCSKCDDVTRISAGWAK